MFLPIKPIHRPGVGVVPLKHIVMWGRMRYLKKEKWTGFCVGASRSSSNLWLAPWVSYREKGVHFSSASARIRVCKLQIRRCDWVLERGKLENGAFVLPYFKGPSWQAGMAPGSMPACVEVREGC